MARTKTITLLNVRHFLRPINSWGPETTVHIKTKYTRYGYTDEGCEVSANISIRDCSESIRLDFDATNERHYQIQKTAIAKLLQDVQALADAWDDAHMCVEDQGGWKP